jgi:hypothetical protein
MIMLPASSPRIFYRCHLKLRLCQVVSALFIILFNFAYAFPQASTVPATGIITDYDRFKDETSVAVSTMLENYTVDIPYAKMQEFLLLVAGFTHQGQRLTVTPAVMRLAFQSQARGWRFNEGTELRGIIDGARIDFGRMSYSRKDLGAGHVEILRLDIPVRTFLKLARSKTAELRVGSKELKLGPQHLAALALLAGQLTGAATSRAIPAKRPVEEKSSSPLNQISQLTLSPTELDSPHASSLTTANKCPIKLPQLLPFRNFRLGMSTAEVMQRFQGTPPPLSKPDEIGRRVMTVDLSRPQAEPDSTGLDKLIFKFLDDRLYQIEATYSIGKEWNKRPMREFADTFTRGLGISALWVEKTEEQFNKQFKLECGEVRLELMIDDETFASFPSSRLTTMAVAFFTLTETATEAQLKARLNSSRQRQQQVDDEKRRIFKP